MPLNSSPSGRVQAEWFEIEPAHHLEYCALMKECWKRTPADRLSFVDIQSRLAALHKLMHKLMARKK